MLNIEYYLNSIELSPQNPIKYVFMYIDVFTKPKGPCSRATSGNYIKTRIMI